MNQKQRNDILDNMVEIGSKVDESIEEGTQTRGNISYYKNFEFKGSGMEDKNVYIVEITNVKQRKTVDKIADTEEMYRIYNEKAELIATVTLDGKIHFTEEYLAQLKSNYKAYFKQLNLKDLDFELPEELDDDDLVMTSEELVEHERKNLNKSTNNSKVNSVYKKQEDEKQVKQETEEEK